MTTIRASKNVIKVAAVAKAVNFSVILRERSSVSAYLAVADLLANCPGPNKDSSSPLAPEEAERFALNSKFMQGFLAVLLLANIKVQLRLPLFEV